MTRARERTAASPFALQVAPEVGLVSKHVTEPVDTNRDNPKRYQRPMAVPISP